MPQTPNPPGPYSGHGAAVENGVAMPELQIEAESRSKPDTIELLLVLAKHKKRIVQITLVAALVALIVTLLLPKMYTATTTILPPQQKQSAATSMIGQFAVISGLNVADVGLKNPADLFVAMLKSRTVEDDLINRFDLRRVYWVKRYQDARSKLDSRSEVIATKEGLISIAVTDGDPNRAADMANAYVNELHNLNQKLAITEAAQRRLFYEEQLKAEQNELAAAELALEQVQQKSGLLQPEAQGKTVIASISDLRAQVASHEVQLQTMRSYATPNNPDLKRAETELAGLRGELTKLEHSNAAVGNGNIGIPARRFPQAELEYLRRARELKYHEALYEFLGKQVEAARIDEANDAFTVQVVDKAVTPEKKSGPKRMVIMLAVTGTAFLLSCLGALLLEALRRRLQDPLQGPRLGLLWRYLHFTSLS